MLPVALRECPNHCDRLRASKAHFASTAVDPKKREPETALRLQRAMHEYPVALVHGGRNPRSSCHFRACCRPPVATGRGMPRRVVLPSSTVMKDRGTVDSMTSATREACRCRQYSRHAEKSDRRWLIRYVCIHDALGVDTLEELEQAAHALSLRSSRPPVHAPEQ